ncbi:uncharacterized protein LDX57_008518 [Aspergillus melleus]|uniref:uncharacterized protein n=1 Tax=Aspergillus melleus TaxID=138277 RepID=UPI001E8D4B7A|nr:uncharacterized protein LDX57_008518 [Aspergillus melleus]KAH8430854.1 hypothetical protein LDX57_008518 [Aspergillus melleus]
MRNFSLEGRIITLEGRKLKIEEQLTEVLDQRMGQRNVLVKTRNIESNIRSLIKMRYQLNPEDFEFVGNDNVEIMKIAWEHFCNEVQAAKLLGEAGLGPQYVDNLSRVQPKWMAFPGGYVDFLVMKPASGENLDAILEELTDRQLASIRTQLAHILE